MAEDKDYIDFGTINSIFSKLKAKFDLKVNKETGKGLSTNDYTTEDKTKLEGIDSGAEVNVQSDWNETDTTSDAFIENKPTIQSISYEQTIEDGTKIGTITIDETSTDIYAPAPEEPTQVTVSQIITEGTNIASISVNGTSTIIKAPTIPENISEFENDANYATEAWVEAKGYTTNAGTITGITMNGSSKGTSGVVDLGTVLTEHQDISGKADIANTVTNVSYDTTSKKIQKTINGTTSDVVTLATVATSNSYNDLDHKLISDTSYLGGHSLLNSSGDENYIKVLLQDSSGENNTITITENEQGNGGLQFGVNTNVIATVSSLNTEIARAEGAETILSGTINGVSSRVDAMSDALGGKQDKLIQGNNITIDTDGTINAFSSDIYENTTTNSLVVNKNVDITSSSGHIYMNNGVIVFEQVGTSTNRNRSLEFRPTGIINLHNGGNDTNSQYIINIGTTFSDAQGSYAPSQINIIASSTASSGCFVNIEAPIITMKGKADFDTLPTYNSNPLQTVRTLSNSTDLNYNTFNDLGILEESKTLIITEETGIVPEYKGQFTIDANNDYTVTFPSGVTMRGDTTFEANGVYQFYICNGYGKIEKVN